MTEAEAGSARPPPRHWRMKARQARETESRVSRRRSLVMKELVGEEDEEEVISGALWLSIDFMANFKDKEGSFCLILRSNLIKFELSSVSCVLCRFCFVRCPRQTD